VNEPILVIGANGLLGSAIVGWCENQGWAVRSTTRRTDHTVPGVFRLDLAEPSSRWNLPTDSRAAILCAGATRLDACHRDPMGTRAINVGQTLKLAEHLVRAGMFVVYLSTNLVFDGERAGCPATEERRPLTEYGRQKVEVERGLESFGERAAVIRLTKVVHAGWALITGWREALRAGQVIRPYAGMVCAPVALDDVARGVVDVARRGLGGLWQFSGPEDVGYEEIATEMARRLGAKSTQVDPVPLGEVVPAEPWPKHTSLETRRAEAELGMTFPPAMDVMSRIFPW
jgi:dTDP-4-dehydrorhamnose reductase